MTLLELKYLTPEHLGALLELDQACFGGLWTLEAYQRELDSPNSDLIGLVNPFAPNSLLGVGCLWAILEEAHITILAVHPQYQRQGFGQALLYGLLSVAEQRNLERATLEVRVSNHAAIALYQKFGFKTAGRRKGYYKDTGEDALILWHNGLAQPEFPQLLSDWEYQIHTHLVRLDWELQIDLSVYSADPPLTKK
ncbi:ribosomal protein S18-alanine N-acetyltransferase [Gloeocapsopsis sp. IPPAS B-1203]|uniref:ribosomal protein S18-alanine N-acetyltransferase n=1 Tax=Gloeocapsopsis sp. IPPAS B-1203 TaxID=2049454 RepID=UPI000C177B67|nr:ribosomal protein S18-alanine N-acetyltransferase [Gloeocapsopsis sp. IPPAS B-1203]PIG92247.1 ribosomal-protein-alanine N-acetyltransferase [Gloeocapsopsis sp. IPPAS B-1203]